MQSPPSSILLYNGRIHTRFDPTVSVEALYLRNDHVIAAGAVTDLEGLADPGTARIDLGDRVVIPGLVDAHLHLDHLARRAASVDCERPTLQDCLDRLSQRAPFVARGDWLLGHGWDQNPWGGFGTRQELDAAVPDHPTYLTAKSGHAGWANSGALKMAGIDETTANPPDGAIQKDDRGRPTGILFEGAMRLVSDHIADPSAQEMARALTQSQDGLLRMGITGVHDFDGPLCFAALQIMREQGTLRLRVVKNIPEFFLEQAIRLGLRSGFGDDWIRIGNIKVFADGALGPRTAAMLEPYAGEPDNKGMLLVDREGLFEVSVKAAESGFGMTVHAIGDRANHELLDAYALLREFEAEHGYPHRRHRVEHLQLLHPDDVDRISELNLIASMQPIHASSDMEIAEQYWGDRVGAAYAWQSQLKAGAVLAFGSDAPVESANPFLGIHAAVTRQRSDGAPGPDGWVPSQRITVEQALAAYTAGPAFAASMEKSQGRLAPGYLADLLVLEVDPLDCEPASLKDLSPTATMAGGHWVYGEI